MCVCVLLPVWCPFHSVFPDLLFLFCGHPAGIKVPVLLVPQWNRNSKQNEIKCNFTSQLLQDLHCPIVRAEVAWLQVWMGNLIRHHSNDQLDHEGKSTDALQPSGDSFLITAGQTMTSTPAASLSSWVSTPGLCSIWSLCRLLVPFYLLPQAKSHLSILQSGPLGAHKDNRYSCQDDDSPVEWRVPSIT